MRQQTAWFASLVNQCRQICLHLICFAQWNERRPEPFCQWISQKTLLTAFRRGGRINYSGASEHLECIPNIYGHIIFYLFPIQTRSQGSGAQHGPGSATGYTGHCGPFSSQVNRQILRAFHLNPSLPVTLQRQVESGSSI